MRQGGSDSRIGRGFTLIELLVVIAIILVLAGLLLGVIATATATARQASCGSQLRQFGQAFVSYCKDYEEFMPPIGRPPRYKWWYEALGQYLDDARIFTCPSKKHTKVGYGVNVRFADPKGDTHNWIKVIPRTVIQRPEATIFIGDTGYPLNPEEPDPQKWAEDKSVGPTEGHWLGDRYRDRNGDGSPVQGKMRFPYHPGYSLYFKTDTARSVPRHRGKCVCVTFDGGIQAHRPADLLAKSYGEPGCLWDNE